MVYQDVMRNSNLSVEAKAIYAYLSSLAGVKNVCYPSVETMQRELCISKNRLMKYMGQLVTLGVVRKVRERQGNIYGRNTYKIIHEVEVSKELKRIFEAVENEALENRPLENEATNNNSINNNSINNNISSIVCPEPDKPVPDLSGILLPLNDKTSYNVPMDKIALWKDTYPAVDVERELKRMIAWLDSNPSRRKTRRGINTFINTWLSREQDKGGRYKNGSRQQGQDRELAPEDYELSPEYNEMYKKYLGKRPPSPDDPFQ